MLRSFAYIAQRISSVVGLAKGVWSYFVAPKNNFVVFNFAHVCVSLKILLHN